MENRRKDYAFDTVISKEVLCNYLSRAATAAGLIDSDTLEDDLRAIANLGLKFLGRTSGIWEPEPDDEEHFRKSAYTAARIHEADPEIILQACIFEAIYREVERFPIPAFVFEAFGLEPEERCFRFEDMRFPEAAPGFWWGDDGAIPDISRQETRLWFFYRAARYIDAGYEALHMGQIHLYTANDYGLEETYRLFGMIRDYAKIHARRHKVLMDAHSHGISRRGELLLDYHAMPFTRFPVLDRKGEKLVLVREGFSEGGKNPNGWEAEAMPYLMEYDNWGGKVLDDFGSVSYEERGFKDWWGYDQIAWFAHQEEESRNKFLEYTWKWTQINNPGAFFEMPFRRTIGSAGITMERADGGGTDTAHHYQINTKSASCPMGFGQEESAKRLYEEGDGLREAAANPIHLIDYGAKDAFDEKTGLKLPEKVVVYGSFQPYVGAVPNDSNSEVTRMYYVGDNTYALSVILPYAGAYDYAVSTYGTLSATYCYDRYPRSGSSNKGYFATKRDNTVIRFTYRFIDNIVKIEEID